MIPKLAKRVLVCGGRSYNDRATLHAVLDYFYQRWDFIALAHGDARGADTLADRWAHSLGIDVEPYPADWQIYGKSAGAIRNQQMLEEFHPDLVIAFPGGRGTADMVRRARRAGVEVIEITATWKIPEEDE